MMKLFYKWLKKFGGIPKEFYEKESMDIFLPILRANFTMLDNYKFQLLNIKQQDR